MKFVQKSSTWCAAFVRRVQADFHWGEKKVFSSLDNQPGTHCEKKKKKNEREKHYEFYTCKSRALSSMVLQQYRVECSHKVRDLSEKTVEDFRCDSIGVISFRFVSIFLLLFLLRFWDRCCCRFAQIHRAVTSSTPFFYLFFFILTQTRWMRSPKITMRTRTTSAEKWENNLTEATELK